MTNIIKHIIEYIIAFIKGLWLEEQVNKAEAEVERIKEIVNESEDNSSTAYTDFKFKLKQYRRGKYADLRSDLERVRGRSGASARDDREAEGVDKEAGKASSSAQGTDEGE